MYLVKILLYVMKIKVLLIVLKMKNIKKFQQCYKLSLMKERVSKEIDLVRRGKQRSG